MKKIAFLLDPDPGHIYPVLGIADAFSEAGVEVHFLGLRDIKSLVKAPHAFHIIFEDVYPESFLVKYKNLQRSDSKAFIAENTIPRPHLQSIMEGALGSCLENIRPDLFIVLYSLNIEAALIQKMYPDLRMAFFTTWLRDENLTPSFQTIDVFRQLPASTKKSIQDFMGTGDVDSIGGALSLCPELIACPKEFDFPNKKFNGNVYHTGALIRQAAPTSFFDGMEIPLQKKIVYLSLGSQTALFPEVATKIMMTAYEFFSSAYNNAFFFILVTGDTDINLRDVPGKVKIVSWAPQLEVLNRASVMITHGGLGAVKECISFQVPMVVIPIIYDQFDNADRVVHHGLGIRTDHRELSMKKLIDSIYTVLMQGSFKKKLLAMNQVFSTYQSAHMQILSQVSTS